MNSGLLDLDSIETWHSDFEELLYDREIWPKVKTKLDSSEMQGIGFLSQVTCADDYLMDDLAQSLRQKGRESLFKRYSYVIGYHGCRLRDPESYQKFGILPSSTEHQISVARSLFQEIPGFNKALVDIEASYLNHNEGKVGLLFSAVRAKYNRSPYVRGSELIRGLAYRLGVTAKARFAGTGKRTLIKCAIPVNWLDDHTTFSAIGAYSNHVLDHLIRIRRWPHDNFIGFDGGYMLTRAIPPESILEFIDMTNFSDDDP
ncbi:MAG: hypothetical protein BVN28_04925 [Nitrospira sp. ST-bin4]|nr:MAG: hypothetical protein BVN28_04925 [Nitrospira sp. ST-bin4]